MKYHPHAQYERYKDSKQNLNVIYVARKRASWNKKLPGAGIFNYHEDLVLTKEKCSRSKWDFKDNNRIFQNVRISYHTSTKKYGWKDGNDYFKSADRGQEFVIEETDKIEEWAKNLVETHKS